MRKKQLFGTTCLGKSETRDNLPVHVGLDNVDSFSYQTLRYQLYVGRRRDAYRTNGKHELQGAISPQRVGCHIGRTDIQSYLRIKLSVEVTLLMDVLVKM